jgi:2-methylisocitrate lyase-like PEP mutase family enzyme
MMNQPESASTSSTAARLRTSVAARDITIAPGCFDALSAALIERAGFECAYLSGASIAYTRFGRPDIGLVAMSEVAETISVIRERTDLPLIVDADTGFGNAVNTYRTVRLFERMGASGVQLEDQVMPKRCGHLRGKSLVAAGEMAGKIEAACAARLDRDTMIIARTDAIAVEGLDSALERADRYVEAGADMLFIEALETREQMQSAIAGFAGRVPLLVNMVEGGDTPMTNAADLQALGFSVVIFPGALVRALTFQATDFLESLRRHGDTKSFANRMMDFPDLQTLLGTAEILEQGKRWESSSGVAE